MVRMEASTAGSRSPMDSAGTDVDGSRATLKITLFVSSSITSNSRKSTLYVLAERGHRNSACTDPDTVDTEIYIVRRPL